MGARSPSWGERFKTSVNALGALTMRATRRVQRLLEELGASPSTRRPEAHESWSSPDNDGTTPAREPTRGSCESPVRTPGRGRHIHTAHGRRLCASAMLSERTPSTSTLDRKGKVQRTGLWLACAPALRWNHAVRGNWSRSLYPCKPRERGPSPLLLAEHSESTLVHVTHPAPLGPIVC
jgi:hypothetical protein